MNSSTGAKLSSWRIPNTRREAVTSSAIGVTLALGLAITLAQTAVVLLVTITAGQGVPGENAYQTLCQWDGHLYARVVRDGYQTTIPPTASIDFEQSNVAFFPGYPLLAHTLRRLSGDWLSIKGSLVLAAQLAAWGFWTYWLLFLRRFRTPRQLALLATLAVALHPGGYYLVVAYSESLFLFGMVGFFYWLGDKQGRWRWALPHGAMMSATRLGGLPVSFVPLIAQLMVEFSPAAQMAMVHRRAADGWQLTRRSLAACRTRAWDDRRTFARLALVGLVASLGGLAFFAYCQWRFGYWDMYFWTQQEGAAVSADWIWWLKPSSYSFFGSPFYEHWEWPDDLSRFCVLLTVVFLLVMTRWELRRAKEGDKTLPQRLPFYLSAAGLFFLHAAGVSPIMMQSMFRYCLVVHSLLLLALLHACRQGPVPAWLARPRISRLAIGFALLACLQIALLWRYFTNQWVA